MKNSRAFAFAAAVALALAAVSVAVAQQPASQQPTTQQQPASQQPTVVVPPTVTVNAVPTPIVIKQPKPKLDRYKGRVLAFNIASLIVQSMENQRMVWSFQYSTDLHVKVADMLSAGGYQPGDKVEVYCKPGTTVAVKLKGKPSKPI